jgi:hypothetical protein
VFQPRHPLRGVREEVGRDPHRRPRREDVVSACDVLLEDVVLHRPAELRGLDALLLRDELVEQEQQRGRRVDRHRRRDLAERDASKRSSMSAIESIATPVRPDLSLRARVVGVVPELRRQVERDAQPGLPALEQVAEALVRLLGRAEAGVLPNRPRPAAVHVGVRSRA